MTIDVYNSPFYLASRARTGSSSIDMERASSTGSLPSRSASTDSSRHQRALEIEHGARQRRHAPRETALRERDRVDSFEESRNLRASTREYETPREMLARTQRISDLNRRAHDTHQVRRSAEMRNSYEARRQHARDRSPHGHPRRSYEQRIESAEGPSSEARLSFEGNRVDERASADRRTDSMSEGSGREGLTMDQLGRADEYGGLRTRSRAEVEMYKRRKQHEVDLFKKRADPQMRPSMEQRRTGSATAVMGEEVLSEDVPARTSMGTRPSSRRGSASRQSSRPIDAPATSFTPGPPSRRGSSSRQPSHPIEIVIHNSLPNPRAREGAGNNEDSGALRRQSTLRWPDALRPDTSSRRYKYVVIAAQSLTALLLGAASIIATYLSARNTGHIADNKQSIDALMGEPPPPAG